MYASRIVRCRRSLSSVTPLWLYPGHVVHSQAILSQQRCFSACCKHGGKTVTRRKVKELAQGALEGQPLPPSSKDEIKKETLLDVIRHNMRKFPDCVILTKVGNFYELYLEHASVYAPLLGLKTAYRGNDRIPMAGFQYQFLERYLKMLVKDLNKHVAILEEFPEYVKGVLQSPIPRRVNRVVTPGTLIDEAFVNPHENNFILSLHQTDQVSDCASPGQASTQSFGLAWIDVSTGDFYVQDASKTMLPSALLRISPNEVVLPLDCPDKLREEILLQLSLQDGNVASASKTVVSADVASWSNMLERPLTQEEISELSVNESCAAQQLLEYVQNHLLELNLKLKRPQKQEQNASMIIDRSSIRGLELFKTSRDGLGKGSLLNVIRGTVTEGGTRLLKERLTYPSIAVPEIEYRQELVSLFVDHQDLRLNMITQLKSLYDTKRLVQKFTLNRGDAEELLCLASTFLKQLDIIKVLDLIAKRDSNSVRYSALKKLTAQFEEEGPLLLVNRIRESIDEQGLVTMLTQNEDGIDEPDELEVSQLSSSSILPPGNNVSQQTSETWIMQKTASPDLQVLHEQYNLLSLERIALRDQLRSELATSTLVLRHETRQGHYVYSPKTKGSNESRLKQLRVGSVPPGKSLRTFYHPSWTDLGRRTDALTFEIRAEETRIFESLRAAVISNILPLRQNASLIDELDIATNFATLAVAESWVRPKITTEPISKILGGRHPTVKLGREESGQGFVSNDLFLSPIERAWLITGPNMAGKSTFLRQNALITILAQVGSYVPCDHAELGIVDKIFSRIGAADDLFRNQSTFMVEMLETATILHDATDRSFVIMDEIGRGTAPEDGTAVAYAALHHLYTVNKCRTLFATHFHRLADLTEGDGWEGCKRYCTDLYEDEEGGFGFVHKLRPGVNRQSHALKVAELAGLPAKTLDMARRVLKHGSQNVNLSEDDSNSVKQSV